MKLEQYSKSFGLLLWLGAATLVQARRGGRGGGGRLGGIFGLERPEFVNTTCSVDLYACPLYHRKQYNQEDPHNGTFVCRTTYHPVSGQNRTKTMCIPNHKGLETDQCGCCGDDCPTKPEFEDIICSGQEDLLESLRASRRNGGFNDDGGRRALQGRGGGGGGRGGGGRGGGGRGGGGRGGTPAIVCREVYNPFTGDPERVTLPIDSSKSLSGDICGCCDGACPDEISRKPFEPPAEVPLDWCAVDELTACRLPKRRGDDDTEEEEPTGVFVCRSRANPLTGVSETKPTCIATDAAWSSDLCGCCGQACPERPEPVDIGCDVTTTSCERRKGGTGVFVCRSLFHPLEGTPVETSLCVPEDKTFADDDCGCCEESGCPSAPLQGFEDEDIQIMSFAMSAAGAEEGEIVTFTADDSEEGTTTTTTGSVAAATTSGALGFSLRMLTTRTSMMVISLAVLWY